MAYDAVLAERIQELRPDLQCKKMFGGLGCFDNGGMMAGVSGDRMMLKVGGDEASRLVEEPEIEYFSPTGKPMRGWITLSQELLAEDDELLDWLAKGKSS